MQSKINNTLKLSCTRKLIHLKSVINIITNLIIMKLQKHVHTYTFDFYIIVYYLFLLLKTFHIIFNILQFHLLSNMRHKRIVTEISNSKHRINHTKGIPRLNFSHRSELTETKLNKQQILKFKIKVCIRIRPINKKENSQQCIRVNSDTMINLQQTQKKQKNYTFVFDKIITQKQSNEQIHDNLCKQLVNSSLKGYNSSIFAYGPTGSGKTFTMFGNSSQPGLIHLSLSYLFSQIQKNIQTHDFIVKMVCVQIYNQNLYDLLSTTSNQVQLRQCPIRGIFLSGATQKMISSQYQAHEILKKVINHRQTNSNNLNEFSSRSHAILQIYLQQKQIGQGLQQQIISSKISLIDLAGSQKMNITNNLYQCKKINQSLLVLGNCIHQLSKNCQKGSKNHIPYRNSKLTRLLKDSLVRWQYQNNNDFHNITVYFKF